MEAYEILSDRNFVTKAIKKSFLDRYGQQRLKNELIQVGNIKGGYKFSNNPEEIFNNFFSNPDLFNNIYGKI